MGKGIPSNKKQQKNKGGLSTSGKPGSKEKPKKSGLSSSGKPGAKSAPKKSGLSSSGKPGAGVVDDPEVLAQLDALSGRVRQAQDALEMTEFSREIDNIEKTIRKLPSEVEKIRSRGYAFRSFMENKAEVMDNRIGEARRSVESTIRNETSKMRDDLAEVNNLLEQQQADELESAMSSLESKIEAAKTHIRGSYADLRADADHMRKQIEEINWFCDRKDEASFDFMAGESLFLAAKAQWDENKDKPEGFIFLTDQRIVFEQKQKVGKRMGMFGGKEVHEMKWEIPLNQVEKVDPENKGMFGGKDMLNFSLGSGAPYGALVVEVKGGVDCKFWAKQIDRMINGDATDERAIEPDPEMIERLREAPTECHVCGGKLPMLVAGQNQMECGYCGSVIRI